MPIYRAQGFGLVWQADIALEQFDTLPASDHSPDIVVARVAELANRPEPRVINRGMVFSDGFRFGWNDEVTFDVFDGVRIHYKPGTAWRDKLPDAFYSTVTGLVLAWRGLLPFHASAFEMDGRAVLLAGPPRAGKSTLAAELMLAGARLISDDLTVLGPLVSPTNGEVPVIYRGRQAIRLHPDTALAIDAVRSDPVPGDPRGRVLVWPRARTDEVALPIAGLILLGQGEGSVSREELVPILPHLLFRPKWVAAIARHTPNRLALLELASRMPAWRIPRIGGFSSAERFLRVEAALAAIAGLTVS